MAANGTGGGAGRADIPDLSRVTYFDGQRLTATDLNAAATVQRELRWLHNRSLHNWGIGLGFGVSGAKGDRQVRIDPGYAVDCLGREIILTESITRAVPARADDGQGRPVIFYLVAAYPDDARLAVLERRQGECGADGAVRLQEQAAIYWKPAGEQSVENGIEIVLAQASVQNCQLAAPLSLDQRRNARPNQQPVVAAGATDLGSTPWEPWLVGDGEDQVLAGVRTEVDTSGARFGVTPEYQAQLQGERVFSLDSEGPLRRFLLDGSTLVSESERGRFLFYVAMPRDAFTIGRVPVNPDAIFEQQGRLIDLVRDNWRVVWIGVEG